MSAQFLMKAVYATSAFRLLAQGMKDREAFAIVIALAEHPGECLIFEDWARARLEEQDALEDQDALRD